MKQKPRDKFLCFRFSASYSCFFSLFVKSMNTFHDNHESIICNFRVTIGTYVRQLYTIDMIWYDMIYYCKQCKKLNRLSAFLLYAMAFHFGIFNMEQLEKSFNKRDKKKKKQRKIDMNIVHMCIF